MDIYTTQEGDQLDDICERHYGYHKGTVEAVLAANINFSANPYQLPAGLKIIMPELTDETDNVIQLFD